jgi:hypothetical protein
MELKMKFLNYDYGTDRFELKKVFAEYKQYLIENRDSFPANAFDFAIAEWHYNFADHRCPHDAWVNSLQVLEIAKNDSQKDRVMEIRINLLGAYHDGEIEIIYQGIKSYNLSLLPDSFESKQHGDWLIDEIRLSDKGQWVIHEIKFWLFGEWQIECEDIKYEWKPFETN